MKGKEERGKKRTEKKKDLEIPLASRLDKHKSRSNSRLDWILLLYVEEGSSLFIFIFFPCWKQRERHPVFRGKGWQLCM